jgi:hypothetical protein
MSLRHEQDLLARVFTDPRTRADFFADPEAVGRDFGIGGREARRLADAAREEVEFFSRTLLSKRAAEVEKLIPETCRALGPGFRDDFAAFAAGYTPRSIKKHLDDAFGFCEFVIRRGRDPKTSATARLERARLLFYGYRRPIVVVAALRPRVFLRFGRRELVL